MPNQQSTEESKPDASVLKLRFWRPDSEIVLVLNEMVLVLVFEGANSSTNAVFDRARVSGEPNVSNAQNRNFKANASVY